MQAPALPAGAHAGAMSISQHISAERRASPNHRHVSHRRDDYPDAAEALDRIPVSPWLSRPYPDTPGDRS